MLVDAGVERPLHGAVEEADAGVEVAEHPGQRQLRRAGVHFPRERGEAPEPGGAVGHAGVAEALGEGVGVGVREAQLLEDGALDELFFFLIVRGGGGG